VPSKSQMDQRGDGNDGEQIRWLVYGSMFLKLLELLGYYRLGRQIAEA
jgi:hypothetical protein